MQSKPSRFSTKQIATPIHRASRFLTGMALHMLELAQRRIAISIWALERYFRKPPPPPPVSPTSPLKEKFQKRAKPPRKLRRDFNES